MVPTIGGRFFCSQPLALYETLHGNRYKWGDLRTLKRYYWQNIMPNISKTTEVNPLNPRRRDFIKKKLFLRSFDYNCSPKFFAPLCLKQYWRPIPLIHRRPDAIKLLIVHRFILQRRVIINSAHFWKKCFSLGKLPSCFRISWFLRGEVRFILMRHMPAGTS